VVLMILVGLALVVGIWLTLSWGGSRYASWDPGEGTHRVADRLDADKDVVPSVRVVTLRYLRGVAIGLVGGFWAGVLVTGPAVRLIMRLLAATAGDRAQGRITEADEVVGDIDLGGTISLIVFGGILTGLLSGVVYVIIRRWLPRGRFGGVVFGALHLVVAATVIDPLRPDNPDFDLVGPGWLSVTTFGLACIAHGMAVVAFADRYSRVVPPMSPTPSARGRVLVPLVLPAALVIVFVPALGAIIAGLAATIVVTRFARAILIARSRALLVAGRVAIGLLTLALVPGVITDLGDVIDRDNAAPAVSPASTMTKRDVV
jgi:hypothetical protein